MNAIITAIVTAVLNWLEKAGLDWWNKQQAQDQLEQENEKLKQELEAAKTAEEQANATKDMAGKLGGGPH